MPRKAKNKKSEPHNGQKKKKYGWIAGSCLGLAFAWGTYAAINAWSIHTFDKYVIKPIEIAANVPSVSHHAGYQSSSGLSMESSLKEAQENLGVSRMKNPAIIWKTPHTEIGTLDDLLGKAVERTRQIGQFQDSFHIGKVPEDAPKWVQDAYAKLNVGKILTGLNPGEKAVLDKIAPSLTELAESEYGQRIGSEYEALNSVVAGGTRTTGKSLEEHHRSLIDTLDKAAGWRSIIRFQADDYKESYAHCFIGYLMANMGYLSEGLNHFRAALRLMEQYPDNKNLALLRNTPELSQKTIKGLIKSSLRELKALDRDPSKYSTGWWKRLRYYNQSIGGQVNPSIQDVAEAVEDRYWARLKWSGFLGLTFLFFGGRYAKRLRNAQRYEVKSEKEKCKEE